MARVTVEDCIEKVSNRFELILLAGQRSRQISNGGTVNIDREKDKNPVISLREIAEEEIDLKNLECQLVGSLQKLNRLQQPSDDEILDVLNKKTENNQDEAVEKEENQFMSPFRLKNSMPNISDVVNNQKFEDVDSEDLID